MLLLDGKTVRDHHVGDLQKKIRNLNVPLALVIIQVGDLAESNKYIEQKKILGERIGVSVIHKKYEADVESEALLKDIARYNADSHVHGIIIQLPLPKHLDKQLLIEAIDPRKDVDGLTAANTKALWHNYSGIYSATTRGILSLLAHYKISVAGKNVVVVGRSALVGKPTALACINLDATVTLCHSKTHNLPEIAKVADVLIVAAGKPQLITGECVREGQVVVDVGINLVTGEKLDEEIPAVKLVGDVDFDAVKDTVYALSPVPGGVGPMTVVSLFENLFDAHTIFQKK